MHSVKPVSDTRLCEGKYSIFAECQAISPGQLVFKTPELPSGLQESIVVAIGGKGVAGCVVSPCTNLVDGEVRGQCHCQSSDSSTSGGCVLMVIRE